VIPANKLAAAARDSLDFELLCEAFLVTVDMFFGSALEDKRFIAIFAVFATAELAKEGIIENILHIIKLPNQGNSYFNVSNESIFFFIYILINFTLQFMSEIN
jgi:hypothetical protein